MTCTKDSAVAKSWGCQAETPHVVDRQPCDCGALDSCPRCQGSGFISLRRCPYRSLPRECFDAIRYVSLVKSGIWPVPGGSLDQSNSFLEAHAVVTAEVNRIEAPDAH